MNRQLCRLTACLLTLSVATTTQAEMIGRSIPTDRERISAFLEREEVGAELLRSGVLVQDAKARVAALSDAEAAALAGRMDPLPAGGFVQIIAAMAMAAAAAIPIIVGAVVVVVGGTVALVGAMAKHGSNAPQGSAALPEKNAAAARRPAAPASPSSRIPFQQGLADASAFPVSTGLYGAVIPAGGR